MSGVTSSNNVVISCIAELLPVTSLSSVGTYNTYIRYCHSMNDARTSLTLRSDVMTHLHFELLHSRLERECAAESEEGRIRFLFVSKRHSLTLHSLRCVHIKRAMKRATEVVESRVLYLL